MAVLKRLSADEIRKNFDHYGVFMGMVPVYVGDVHGECRLSARNWVPEWWLDLWSFVGQYIYCPEEGFMIELKGEIEGHSHG